MFKIIIMIMCLICFYNCNEFIEFDENISACTNVEACNYDSNATEDDGSCYYSTMCDDGSYECDASDCQEIQATNVEILYNSTTPIGGFQFAFNEVTILGAYGGDAGDAGFTISAGENIVLAFSLTGATIPAGSGTLVHVSMIDDTNVACLSDLVFSDSEGESLNVTIESCTIIHVP